MAKEIVLDQAQVMGYLESSEDFPIDFEAAWRGLDMLGSQLHYGS